MGRGRSEEGGRGAPGHATMSGIRHLELKHILKKKKSKPQKHIKTLKHILKKIL